MKAPLVRAALFRLAGARRTWWLSAAWVALALAVAVTARVGRWAQPTDRVLLGAYAPLVLPLLVYTIAGAAVGWRPIAAAVRPLVSFGAAPGRTAGAIVVVGVAAAACASAVLSGVIVLVAHGAGDVGLARDAWASTYAGGLSGAAYASWFLLGSTFGKRGGGRALLLVLDWLVGADDGAPAVLAPRGHVRNLFGGSPPLHLSERVSAAALLAFVVACGLVAVLRAQRRALG